MHAGKTDPDTNQAKEKKELAKKKIEVSGASQSLSFTKKNLVDIIQPRVSEILDVMQRELKKIGRQELLPGGVVLTGGGAKIPKIKDLAKQQLRLPCQIGIPKGIDGLQEDPALATVAGLVMGSADFDDSGSDSVLGMPMGFLKNMGSKIKRMLRVFIP